MNESLKTSLNAIREISSDIYHRSVPIIDENTDIATFANPIMTYPVVYNEFQNQLINKLVFTQFEMKAFRNPLVVLEGDALPLGYGGENIYVNPSKGRQFNVNDFAGLLVKYETDVKVEYLTLNMDLQYCVTYTRQQLKKAFRSWGDLEAFIDELSNSLYNGAFIDEWKFTKQLISSAYDNNMVMLQSISAISSADTAKAFVEKARELYLNFQTPSDKYNAWHKVGGEGRPVTTWTNPEDIVILVRNDIRAKLDVEVLANAFNIDKTTLLGNMLLVDNFDVYDDEGTKVFDGSAIVGGLFDKAWFKIRRQDLFLESFYNPNNRTTQYYLNLIKMYRFSLFANGVLFVTSNPTVPATDVEFLGGSTGNVEVGKKLIDVVKLTPAQSTSTVTIASSDNDVATASVTNGVIEITGVSAGSATITLTAGTVSDTKTVTVSNPVIPITSVAFASATGTVAENADITDTITVLPANGNTPQITVVSSAEEVATASIEGKVVTITGVSAGSATITVSAGAGVVDTKLVTVTS